MPQKEGKKYKHKKKVEDAMMGTGMRVRDFETIENQ